jgi:hypothetical protein
MNPVLRKIPDPTTFPEEGWNERTSRGVVNSRVEFLPAVCPFKGETIPSQFHFWSSFAAAAAYFALVSASPDR